MPRRILVVDDEPLKRITLQIELAEAGYEVAEAADAATAKRLFESQPFDAVVSDVRMPGMNGLELLTHLKQTRPDTHVILMTAYATIESAVLAIKRGAYDYITKPFTTQDLLEKLDRLFADLPAVSANGQEVEQFGRLAGRSGALKRLFAQVKPLAGSERPILICGEGGVGKELLAEAIHAAGPRADRPFLRIRCGGAPAGVLESELFGHEKGAFTGALRPKPGRLEAAEGGTLLLDEIDELPAEAQTRLLRAVENGEVERLGGDAPVRVDARLLCTTRTDLAQRVREGAFREDLYFCLNALAVTIPPLRERPDDVSLLAQHFLEKHAALVGDRKVALSPHALDELLRYRWPGNVRELEHVIERALAMCGGREIRPEHVLPLGVEEREAAPVLGSDPTAAGRQGLNETVAEIERRMILLALRQCNGNQARAAQKLGIPRTTLRDKMAKYSIPGALADAGA